LFGQSAELDVGFLRPPLEQVERRAGVNPIDPRQDSLDLFDNGPFSEMFATASVMLSSRASSVE
jgi:hypothetical protein